MGQPASSRRCAAGSIGRRRRAAARPRLRPTRGGQPAARRVVRRGTSGRRIRVDRDVRRSRRLESRDANACVAAFRARAGRSPTERDRRAAGSAACSTVCTSSPTSRSRPCGHSRPRPATRPTARPRSRAHADYAVAVAEAQVRFTGLEAPTPDVEAPPVRSESGPNRSRAAWRADRSLALERSGRGLRRVSKITPPTLTESLPHPNRTDPDRPDRRRAATSPAVSSRGARLPGRGAGSPRPLEG